MVQVQRREGLGVREQDLQCLQHSTLFGDVTLEELEPLAEVAHRYALQLGELLDGSEEGDAIFIVIKGGIRLYLLSPEGREMTLGYRGPAEVFELGDTGMPGEAIVEASEDETVVYAVSWAELLEILYSNTGPAVPLASLLRQGHMEERQLVGELAFYGMKARLAHVLAEWAARNRWRMVTKTHEELASMVGTRPEEVTKALRNFRECGLVAFKPHERGLTVLRIERLASYGEEPHVACSG